LPTFDRPANAICATPSAGIPSARPPASLDFARDSPEPVERAAALVTKSALMTFNVVRDSLYPVRDSHKSRVALANREP
jgi:hypothetical protein